MLDVLTAILALLFGADTPAPGSGMDDHSYPMCWQAPEYYTSGCMFVGTEGPSKDRLYLIDSGSGRTVLLTYI